MALIHTYFFSEALGMCASCDVILPQLSMNAECPDKFRTLWLLHGMSDDETIWQRRTSIERYAAPLGLAVVMPAVALSGYADMEHGMAYYTYVSKELPRLMRSFFPLSARREDNYIAGLSMGGAGALKIGLANPTEYSAICCLSAGCINRNPARDGTPAHAARQHMLYGDRTLEGTEEDVFGSARRICESGVNFPRIYHSCGSEDFILGSALRTKEFFEAIPGNPFDYTYEQDPGVHSWEYWDEHIQRFLKYLKLEQLEGIKN